MLFSREARKKLSALRRRPRAEPTPPVQPAPGKEPGQPSWSVDVSGGPATVGELFPGEELETSFGPCYVVRSQAGLAAESAREALRCLDRTDGAFLDIETLGLSSMPVFLIGVLRCGPEEAELVQYLARDFPEEAPILARAESVLRAASVLFTYNGAAFDLPYLQERAVYHAVDWQLGGEHVDLLKPARRRFRGRFPDCRLQTLESRLCGRMREADIPGAQIPKRYEEFARTQDARLLQAIVEHNRLDLLTLAEIVPHCLA
jgi:uncharacterized protein YprB with RNaseH-like and TPR domain